MHIEKVDAKQHLSPRKFYVGGGIVNSLLAGKASRRNNN